MTVVSNKLCVSDSVMLSPLFIALVPNQISFTHTHTHTHTHRYIYINKIGWLLYTL